MIGLPHQPPANESPTPSNPVVAMEAREGKGNAFACERCRKHKVRCVPSSVPGMCQRCQRARAECVEHFARRRLAKPRTLVQAPNRVAEMEGRLDTGPSAPLVYTLSSPPPRSEQTPILPNPSSAPESAFWESINETISGLGRLDPVIRSISVIHMQLSLETYRTMTDFFPFVMLPKDSYCRDLIQQRPMLMFAVLTAASYDSALLQLTLSREFRKVIMVKIMNGEKSLDLLQGLLVFIAWHHHYMDAQAVSIHLLLQICVGIVGDLGLDKLSSATRSPLPEKDVLEREAKRAYLGCYYLASTLVLVDSGRARSMSCNSTLRTYASQLASGWEHRSDTILPLLIDTCQFMEDVEETFRHHSDQVLIAKAQLKRLNERWDSLRDASQSQAKDYKTLQWIQLASRIHLFKTAASLELSDRESTSWAPGFILSQRITCLQAVEQFLHNSLLLQPSQYEFLSITDWVHLVSSLTTLGQLMLHTSPMPGWGTAEFQIAKTFDYFRNQLCSQMPRSRDTHENSEDFLQRFRRITAIMKTVMKTSAETTSPNESASNGSAPNGSAPSGSTFELATGSGRTVSLLQDVPPLTPNGVGNGADPLPAPWKVNPNFDMQDNEFPWKFLMGTV